MHIPSFCVYSKHPDDSIWLPNDLKTHVSCYFHDVYSMMMMNDVNSLHVSNYSHDVLKKKKKKKHGSHENDYFHYSHEQIHVRVMNVPWKMRVGDVNGLISRGLNGYRKNVYARSLTCQRLVGVDRQIELCCIVVL